MPSEFDRDRAARARARRQRAAKVQRRRLVFLACLLALVLVIVILAAKSCGDKGTGGTSSTGSSSTDGGLASASYTADLTGADSVPAVDTEATAIFTLDYDAETGELTYELEVTDPIESPTLAAIYEGSPGDYGSAIYTLFSQPDETGERTGILAQGTIAEEKLVGALKNGTVADLIQLLKDGDAYVSIGNEEHPVDAIRGQIKGTSDSGSETESTTESDTTTESESGTGSAPTVE